MWTFSLRFCFCTAFVGVFEKVDETLEEEECIEQLKDWDSKREIIVVNEKDSLKRVRQKDDKLNNLHLSDVLLPPKMLLHGRHGWQEVISVHDCVDTWVDDSNDAGPSNRSESQGNVSAERHDTVMYDMKKGYLFVFLSQDEEDSVEQV